MPLWRIGSNKRCMGQIIAPMRRQPNQIVAIRAIAVAEHDQLGGSAGSGRNAWAIKRAHALTLQ
jgi:hypothetical protein